jgi:hypothetical protein
LVSRRQTVAAISHRPAGRTNWLTELRPGEPLAV